MDKYVQNSESLSDHGNISLRKTMIDIIDHSVCASDPYQATRRLVCLNGEVLHIGDLTLSLKNFERIRVIGAGKATYPIAKALEDILGDRITDGLIVLKRGSEGSLKKIQVLFGSHPIPDEDGHQAAKRMMELAESCTSKDLVLAAITGGSSALLPLPVEGVSLADKKRVNELLLMCGAEITQINAVRKHLSRIKGGRLANKILPATLVNLTVSDVIGDPLDYITCPTVPDTSTFADARKVLDDFDLWSVFPSAAAEYLKNGCEECETPKSFPGLPLYTYIVVTSAEACVAAEEYCRKIGYSPILLTTMLKGEAREAGSFLGSIAQEIVQFQRPLHPPCAIICGGENTVTITGTYGLGGPNQEFSLAAAREIAGLENVLVAAIDTDGTDGPTELAGGMVDGFTRERAHALGIDLYQALRQHATAPALLSLQDAVITGQTGTNINDLKILLVK